MNHIFTKKIIQIDKIIDIEIICNLKSCRNLNANSNLDKLKLIESLLDIDTSREEKLTPPSSPSYVPSLPSKTIALTRKNNNNGSSKLTNEPIRKITAKPVLLNQLTYCNNKNSNYIKTKYSSSITCLSMLIQTIYLKSQFVLLNPFYYTEANPNSTSYKEINSSLSNTQTHSLSEFTLYYLINSINNYKCLQMFKNEINDSCFKQTECFHFIYATTDTATTTTNSPLYLHITNRLNNKRQINMDDLIELTQINNKQKQIITRYKLLSVIVYNTLEYHQFIDPRLNGLWYKYEFGKIIKSSLKDANKLLFKNNYMLIYIRYNNI
jgi:hypothetical protein